MVLMVLTIIDLRGYFNEFQQFDRSWICTYPTMLLVDTIKAVQNRNAQIAEQEAAQIEKQNEFDIARFDQQFQQLEGQTKVASLKSGTTLSGSALRVMRYNAEQAELQKDIMTYNSKIAQSQKIEEANFARIQGTIARQQGRQAQLAYFAKLVKV
jgi:hypothetical protein